MVWNDVSVAGYIRLFILFVNTVTYVGLLFCFDCLVNNPSWGELKTELCYRLSVANDFFDDSKRSLFWWSKGMVFGWWRNGGNIADALSWIVLDRRSCGVDQASCSAWSCEYPRLMDVVFVDIHRAILDFGWRTNRALTATKRMPAMEIRKYFVCRVAEIFSVEQLVFFPVLYNLRTKRWFNCVWIIASRINWFIWNSFSRPLIDFCVCIIISLWLVELKLQCLHMFHVKMISFVRTWKDELSFIKFLKKSWWWRYANIFSGGAHRPST